MLPVGRKPVVQYVVEELAQVGIDRLLFITGPGKTSIENHFDLNHELTQTLRNEGKEELLGELSFERASIQYFYTRQRQLLGLGHAILCAEPFISNEPFVVALGDSIIGMHGQNRIVERMTECYHKHHADAVIAFEEVPSSEVFQYGIAQPKKSMVATDTSTGTANTSHADTQTKEFFEVEDLIEKPAVELAPSNLAIAARYILKPGIFDALRRTKPGVGGEIQLTDAIRLMMQEGATVYGVRLNEDETRYDIGNFGSYFKAFTEFALADKKFGEELHQYLKMRTHEDHS